MRLFRLFRPKPKEALLIPSHFEKAVNRESPERTGEFCCPGCGNRTEWSGMDDLEKVVDGQRVERKILYQRFITSLDGQIVFRGPLRGLRHDENERSYQSTGYTRIACVECSRYLWIDRFCPAAVGRARGQSASR